MNSTAPFGGSRFGGQLLGFGSQLWLIGGGQSGYGNDVWSSSDGVTWNQKTAAAGFAPRRYPQALVFNNKLWVIGGFSSSLNYLNDIWYTQDGYF